MGVTGPEWGDDGWLAHGGSHMGKKKKEETVTGRQVGGQGYN